MQLTTLLTTFLLSTPSLALALPSPNLTTRAVDPALVPEFGITAGQNPQPDGSCTGAGGASIPCTCPPDRNAFLDTLNSLVDNGQASFPTGDDADSKRARIMAAMLALQNVGGSAGVGCPVASTTFQEQLDAV